MNFYNISEVPSRLQTAQHFHSSLEEPTLDNVEAQLQVARQRNYELSLSYFQNKYGNGEVYNRFVEENQLEGLGPPKGQEDKVDFRRELDRQAMEIQERENKKIQARKGMKGDVNEDEERGKALRRAKDSAKKDDVEDERVRKKLAEDNSLYEISIVKEKEGAFMSEFKNYLSNKRKVKEEIPRNTVLDKSLLATSNLRISSLSQSKQGKKENEGVKYEEELVRKILKEISGKSNGSVERLQLIEYLTANPRILKVIGISPADLPSNLALVQSKDMNIMTEKEVLMFVLGAVGKGEEARRVRAEGEFNQVPSGCMIKKDVIGRFEEIFRVLDRHNDLLVQRLTFIERLTSDPLIKINLNLPSVFEPQYNRHISLRRIFERIEMEALLGNENEKLAHEFISWQQFMSYFESGHKTRMGYELPILIESLKSEKKFGLGDIPEAVFEILVEAIRKVDRGEEMMNTQDILDEIKLNREYEIEKFTFVRRAEDGGEGLGSETLEDVLVRIRENGLRYVTAKEFLEYFSTRGRPIEEYERERHEQLAKNLSGVKVSFAEQNLFDKNDHNSPEGYDSDPETYNHSAILDPSRSQKEFKRFKATAQSFLEPENNYRAEEDNTDGNNNYNKGFKLTVPQPFSFEEREKERKQREKERERERREKEDREREGSGFRAGAIPALVREVGVLEKMGEEQKRREEARRRSSMLRTLALEKPFSFEGRKVTKKTKAEREEYHFKAKPIPWFCSVDLLKQKEEAEILRNERIAKLAQENLAKAKLPPRMEKDLLEKEAKKAFELQKSNKRPVSTEGRVKDPPDFERLHREFELAMERKRKEKKGTQINEFNFTAAKSKLMPEEKIEPKAEGKGERKPEIASLNIDIFAQSTAKFTQQVEKRREEAEAKRKEEAEKKRAEEARLRTDEELKAKVQEAARRKKENEGVEEERRREEAKGQKGAFAEWKKGCVERGRQQPLLIDRVSKRDEKVERMRKLYEISSTLKKNGIIGKEHDHYFKREELLLLQDYAILKDQL